MSGKDMRHFVPVHLPPQHYNASLAAQLGKWLSVPELKALRPEDWFYKGLDLVGGTKDHHGVWMPRYESGVHLWTPPPAAARVAMEQLRRARHSRQCSTHIFVCPRLMTYEWQRLLWKEADVFFKVPAGASDLWPLHAHEPLFVGICLPFIRVAPWKLGGTPKLLALERNLRRVFGEGDGDAGPLLRQLLSLPRRLDAMSPSVVRQVLHFQA